MKKFNKVFAVSALSLAVSGANAEGGSECDSFTDVNSFSVWGNPALLTICVLGDEPTASGGDNSTPRVDPRDVGRHDSASFEPEINADNGPELHIALPDFEDGGLVLYTAAMNISLDESFDDSLESVFEDLIDNVDEMDPEDVMDLLPNPDQVGSASLALVDSEEDDQIVFLRADSEGNTIATKSYSFVSNQEGDEDNGSIELGGAEVDGFGDNVSFGGGNIKASISSTNGNEGTSSLDASVQASGVIGGAGTMDYENADEEQLLVNYWSGLFVDGSIAAAENCVSHDCDSSLEADVTVGSIVGGYSTPLADINALVASDVTLRYSGNSMFFGKTLDMEVDFGKETASGSFTGGGGTDFGFDANLVGPHIVSTQVTANQDISGYVQGTLLGDQAAGVAGAYRIETAGGVEADTFQGARSDLNPLHR
jgi:hypothetical protein